MAKFQRKFQRIVIIAAWSWVIQRLEMSDYLSSLQFFSFFHTTPRWSSVSLKRWTEVALKCSYQLLQSVYDLYTSDTGLHRKEGLLLVVHGRSGIRRVMYLVFHWINLTVPPEDPRMHRVQLSQLWSVHYNQMLECRSYVTKCVPFLA